MLLGASLPYLPNIKAAKASGYRVVLVDGNPNAIGFEYADESLAIDITSKEDILRVAREMQIDGIVPMNDFGVPTASYVSEVLGIP